MYITLSDSTVTWKIDLNSVLQLAPTSEIEDGPAAVTFLSYCPSSLGFSFCTLIQRWGAEFKKGTSRGILRFKIFTMIYIYTSRYTWCFPSSCDTTQPTATVPRIQNIQTLSYKWWCIFPHECVCLYHCKTPLKLGVYKNKMRFYLTFSKLMS